MTMNKHLSAITTLLLACNAGVMSVSAIAPSGVHAVRLSDGRVYFTNPPRLINSYATQTQTAFNGSTYYFTLMVPENAGEPLGQVTIELQDGSTAARRINYRLEDTSAFLGTHRNQGERVPLGEVGVNPDDQSITVPFAPPVSPGSTVTIALRPDRNPNAGGVYLFGVTAFPPGEPAHGQFLGYGRFHFDEPDRFLFH